MPFFCSSQAEEGSDGVKPVFVLWSLAVLATLLCAAGTACLIDDLYHPDIDAALRLARSLTMRPLGDFQPEPKEKALFLSCLISCPLGLFVFSRLSKLLCGVLSAIWLNRLFHLLVCLQVFAIVALGAAGFLAANPSAEGTFIVNDHDALAKTNWKFYFITTFLEGHFPLYLFLVFPVLFLGIVLFEVRRDSLPALARTLVALPVAGWCGGLVVAVFFMNFFRFPYTYENKYDFGAVYYSMVQVYHGLPMLVDGFTNTYGLYPHFLNPLLHLTGLSIGAFSGVMSFLTAAGFLCILFFLRRYLRSDIVILLSFSALVFYTHIFFRIVTSYDAIYASQPIRFIFPAFSLALAPLCLRHDSLLARGASLWLLSWGILWNPEFGILTYLAFVLFLFYAELGSNARGGFFRRSLVLVPAAAAMPFLNAACYALYIRVAYGAYPDLLSMFGTLRMFSFIGAGMMPMPLLHPWNLVALLYLYVLAYCLRPLLVRSATPRHAALFLVLMLGIGSFGYYQGRSHNWNLLVTAIYAFILAGALLDDLLLLGKSNRIFYLPAALLIFLLGSSLVQLPASADRVVELFRETDNKRANLPEQNYIVTDSEFIRQETRPGEKVLILVCNYYQALYYGLSGTAAAVNPGFMDMFLRADYERLLVFLANNTQTKVFFDPNAFRRFAFDDRIPLLLSALYEVRKTNGSVMMLGKKE